MIGSKMATIGFVIKTADVTKLTRVLSKSAITGAAAPVGANATKKPAIAVWAPRIGLKAKKTTKGRNKFSPSTFKCN